MAHRTAVNFFCSCVEKTPSPWWVMLEKPYLKALVNSAEWRTQEEDKVELEREAWGRVRWTAEGGGRKQGWAFAHTARRLMLAPGEGHCRSTDTHHLWAYSVTLFLSTYTPDAKTFYKIHIIKIFKCIFAFPGILCHSCCWTMNTCTQVTIENGCANFCCQGPMALHGGCCSPHVTLRKWMHFTEMLTGGPVV